MRKVIQLSAASAGNAQIDIFALCDDGTMWKSTNGGKDWKLLTNIPQPEKPAASFKKSEKND